MDTIVWNVQSTSWGDVFIAVADEECVVGCTLPGKKHIGLLKELKEIFPDYTFKQGTSPLLKESFTQMKEYFAGKRLYFEVPIYIFGTDFQRKVWKALVQIPYGETVSYNDIAKKIKSPKAVRAVGSANGKNRVPIMVPCHRVIAKNGSLAGFAGGVSLKKKLLDLEFKRISS